jgi:acyl carrier protein
MSEGIEGWVQQNTDDRVQGTRSMTRKEIHSRVETFIRENFVFEEKRQIGDEESFLDTGLMDSTGILELISFLEETFAIRFADSELVADNFDTLGRVTRFIAGKLGEVARG